MAKARVDIVCECCGEMFTVEKIVRNTAAKESYEEWARKNITVCSTCLKKQEIENAVERGDATVEHMLYKDCKNEWPTCKTVPDSYDAETKTVDVVISKRDRMWHDIQAEFPAEKKNDKSFLRWWKNRLDMLVTNVPLEIPEDAPEWGARIFEIINNIYA